MSSSESIQFEAIYEAYWDKVFRICIGYTGNQADAKDLSQEAFINIWKSFSSFRNESALSTWIFRVTTNVCLRYIEKHKRKDSVELARLPEEVEDSVIKDKVSFLHQCISELPELDRLIISMELEDMKQAEIAEIIGITDENVRVRIHRIKKKLAVKFENYEH